jgi:hypothetical protein
MLLLLSILILRRGLVVCQCYFTNNVEIYVVFRSGIQLAPYNGSVILLLITGFRLIAKPHRISLPLQSLKVIRDLDDHPAHALGIRDVDDTTDSSPPCR